MDSIIYFTEKFSTARFVPPLLVLTLFAMPLSSTGKSVLLTFALIAILMAPAYRAQLSRALVKPWCIAAFILFGLALVGCLWSPATSSEKFLVVSKYSKLLYLPLLVIGFTDAKVRNDSIHAFMLAMLLTCIISILKFHGFLQSWHIDFDNVFRNHIMTGFMVAFASYLAVFFAYQQRDNKTRAFYLLVTVIYSYHVWFVNGGRTGYIIYLLLMGLLMVQLCTWRQAMAVLLIGCSLFAFMYLQSSHLRSSIGSVTRQLQDYHVNKIDNSASLGLRLKFHDFAQTLFEKHPIAGNGTASFTYYFRIIRPVAAWVWRDGLAIPYGLLEPHSQYWLVAAEFGIIGLLVLGYFFYSLFRASLKLKHMKTIALGMLVFFMIGNLSDSLLFYSGSGYFFLLIMAVCLGEQVEEDGPI
ncbi:MAG: O-antigen ligase family protein [Legionella sp.]|nr:O-antigen ligase family protein [Legionella sp.]